eukprot:scaffold91719_cov43-Cyclotella_meneghiniana.AAC.4
MVAWESSQEQDESPLHLGFTIRTLSMGMDSFKSTCHHVEQLSPVVDIVRHSPSTALEAPDSSFESELWVAFLPIATLIPPEKTRTSRN